METNETKQINEQITKIHLEKLQAEQKVELLRRAFLELLETYHQLANITFHDRHISSSHKECTEQSCTSTMAMLNKIMEG